MLRNINNNSNNIIINIIYSYSKNIGKKNTRRYTETQ